MPKVKRSKGGSKKGVVSLADQIMQGDAARVHERVKSQDKVENEDEYVDERLSRRILEQARIQQDELQTEYGLSPETKKAPVTTLGKSINNF
jgi:essential nuclear protein 1